MKKKNKFGKYEKGVIITGIAVLIIFLILLTADGIKNIGKNKQNLALSEQEEIVPPNVPVLSAGMIPVKYDGDNLIICKNDNSWYSYENGTPAYMMLNDGVYQSELVVDMTNKKLASDSLGQVVAPEDQGSIYMWLPRFEINGEDNIKYVKEVNYESDGYEIPEMFTYKQAIETSPDFLLTGIWIEKTPLTSTSEVTTKITNMTGENNTYGFIANTIPANAGEGDSPVAAASWLTGTVPDAIADPSNPNRTILKILNDKYQDPIKAKGTYNATTKQIEITVTYSKYGINKIMLEDTNELTLTNTNGIITASTSGAPGKNKITITDNAGNKKNIKVTVPYSYGNKVFGYECATEGVEWRLFHADDNNIYLIADDYIPYANLPTSTNGTALNKGDTDYQASFTDILNDYTGSRWIKENTNVQAQKWLSKYLTSYSESTNENMKAVAYMMDTESWSTFAGDKAEYAIGGPTIELFCASYKVTHPSRYIECDSINEYGYQVKWSDGSYTTYINGLTQDDFNSIYIKSDSTKAYGMWLASPSAGNGNLVMYAGCDGYVNFDGYYSDPLGFRPVVCLKSDVKLVDNGDNTYSIKETITAKAEYNKNTNQIEVRVSYSDNPISKIMLNDTNELQMTNTNGIIIANTAGIGLVGRNHKITIIDNKGNKKELEVVLPISIHYGKEVTNYTCEASGVDKWRVFHVDDNNIYLIADDYVPYANLPTSTAGTALNKGNTNYRAYFTAILNNYTGSAWIRTNTNEQARNWLSWVNRYPSSTNNNIKAVAYMMDTNKWSSFAGEKAEYAIGGPTLELFCASYKVTHPDRYIECASMTTNGYQVKWSNGSYANSITGLTQDDFNSIYIKSNQTKANGMWLASPSANGTNGVMAAYYYGGVNYYTYSNGNLGFRPLVCLKSGVKLIDNGDGTCSAYEQIDTSIEYKEANGTIEITVNYSENGISKIEDENGKNISFTNENGKIKAVTSSKPGKNKFIITDNKGNKKEIETTVILPIYATLYTDGTLALTATDRVLDGKTVANIYGDISKNEYNVNTIPWASERESIIAVDIVDKIYPMTTAVWFYNCTNLIDIFNIVNLDTRNVNNMNAMFCYCSSLTQIDLSNFDTSSVTNMNSMFYGSSSLTELDLGNFDTSSVINMDSMFFNCSNLIELDLSNFDTRNVTTMGGMFAYCKSLTELDLSNFDTGNVATMASMFSNCKSLTELDLSNFKTSNVLTMDSMFSGCSNLTQLDLSNFDINNLIYMNNMFYNCSRLIKLDVSSFNTNNVTIMQSMFNSCSSLTELDLSSFNTAKVTNMNSMFQDCTNLKTIYVGANWKLATTRTNMFTDCGTSTTTRK